MALLKPEQLSEILSDLGPDLALPDDRRSALCAAINKEFNYREEFRQILRDATPHKRLEKWQQIARFAGKLEEVLRDFDFDLEWAIDRVRGHPRATRPPTQEEVEEEMSVDPRLAVVWGLCHKANSLYPSRESKEEAHRIKENLSTLVAAAQIGVSHDRERKDSRRKHDRCRDILLVALASIYEETFRTNASARREGRWPTFLSRVLSILEDKATTPDAAYEAWLQVKKRLKYSP